MDNRWNGICRLSKQRAFLLLLDLGRFQSCKDGLVEDVLQTLLCQSRAFDVLNCSEFPCKFLALLKGYCLLLCLGELLNCSRIISQVNLSADQKEGCLGAMVSDLWYPLQGEERC